MTSKRFATNHTGVFYREKQAADGKTVRTYYVLFKRDGRLIETKVGLSTRGMTVAKAAQLRAQMMDGKRQTAAERRLEIAQNPDLTSLWAMYSEQLKNERTRATFGSDFARLPERIKSMKPHEIDDSDLRAARADMEARNLAPQSVKHSLALIPRMCRWGARRKLCSGLPQGIGPEMPRVQNQVTEFLTATQMSRLWTALDEDADQQSANIVRLAALTGIRKTALLNLRWADVDWENATMTLKAEFAKSGRTAAIPLAASAVELLHEIQEHPLYDASNPLIFPSPKTGGVRCTLSPSFARRIKEAAQLPEKFRLLHGLRHSLASHLASSGKVSLLELQRLLTHESSKMTERYAHLMDEAMRRAAGVVDDVFKVIK